MPVLVARVSRPPVAASPLSSFAPNLHSLIPPSVASVTSVRCLSWFSANHFPELILLHDLDPELVGLVQLASRVLTGKQIASLFADAGGDPSTVAAYQLFKDF